MHIITEKLYNKFTTKYLAKKRDFKGYLYLFEGDLL